MGLIYFDKQKGCIFHIFDKLVLKYITHVVAAVTKINKKLEEIIQERIILRMYVHNWLA